MPFCIGVGHDNGDHCCYVNGEVCPHYLTTEQAQAWVDGLQVGNPVKRAIRDFVTGFPHLCKIGLMVLRDTPGARGSQQSHRDAYDAAFAARAEYQATPAPAWRTIEAAHPAENPPGSLDCFRWQGEPDETSPTGRTCCYRMTTAEATQRAQNNGATVTAVGLRQRGGRPD